MKPGIIVCGNYRLDKMISAELLGNSGCYLWMATDLNSGNKVTVKDFPKKRHYQQGIEAYDLQEIQIMKTLKSPYIVKYLADADLEDNKVLVMEFCKHSLTEVWEKYQKMIPEQEAVMYLSQIVMGLQAVHKENISHRDLKIDNIMLDDQNQIKVIDFGCSTQENICKSEIGTPNNMAPEIFQYNDFYDPKKADIYSLGVLFYQMLTGKYPFEFNNPQQLFEQDQIAYIPFNKPNNKELSNTVKNLIRGMLQYNPKDRITLEEILPIVCILSFPENIAIKKPGIQMISIIDKNLGRLIDSKYVLVKRIGQKQQRTLYQAVRLDSYSYLCVKIIKMSSINDSKYSKKFELFNQFKEDNQHILDYFSQTHNGSELIQKINFCSESLQDELSKDKSINGIVEEHLVVFYIAQILSAYQQLHLFNIRDKFILLENIMISKGQLKVIHFTDFNKDCKYMSPESLNGDGTSQTFDNQMYALGVLLYQILFNQLPYQVQNSKSSPLDFDPNIPRSTTIKNLLKRMLNPKKEGRIKFFELYQQEPILTLMDPSKSRHFMMSSINFKLKGSQEFYNPKGKPVYKQTNLYKSKLGFEQVEYEPLEKVTQLIELANQRQNNQKNAKSQFNQTYEKDLNTLILTMQHMQHFKFLAKNQIFLDLDSKQQQQINNIQKRIENMKQQLVEYAKNQENVYYINQNTFNDMQSTKQFKNFRYQFEEYYSSQIVAFNIINNNRMIDLNDDEFISQFKRYSDGFLKLISERLEKTVLESKQQDFVQIVKSFLSHAILNFNLSAQSPQKFVLRIQSK